MSGMEKSKDDGEPTRSEVARRPYRSPVLTEYGPVSVLTGGSGGMAADGGGAMTMMI